MTKNYTTDRELYDDALVVFGRDAQLGMIVEECAELIVAINQWSRGRLAARDVIDELADVEIMIEQARVMFGDSSVNDAKREKLRRLEKRLQGAME